MGSLRGPNPHSAPETELTFRPKVTSQVPPGFSPKSHTSEGGWDFVAFGPLQDVFHATWASPKWSTTWAALTESLEDEVQTSPRNPSSNIHVGVLADTCQSRCPGLPERVVPLAPRSTQVPNNVATPIACLTQVRR